ncbi:MAG: hypothetical protein WDZ93_01325 [Candidatus Paceibacterota bacterium]
MTKEEVIKHYTKSGLTIEEGFDKPGTVYEPHRHERTYLWTLFGSITLRKGTDDWRTYTTGEECVIEDGEVHEAKIGPEGWKYIAAFDAEEAKKYEDAH